MKVSSPPRFQRAFHRFLWPVLLMTTWLWLAGMGQVLGAEPVPGAGAAFDQESYADQYQAAKDFFHRLEQDSTFGRERGHWLQGARNFRKIHLSQKRSALGPPSLFMLGKLYRQMYERFHVPIDLDNAITSFKDLAALYPANSLADDALLAAAESLHLRAGGEDEARAVLRTIIEVYPKGDQRPTALARLLAPSGPVPAVQAAAPRQAAAPAATLASFAVADSGNSPPPSGLAEIAPVKYWSSANYTRIVIEATAAVPFAPTLLEKSGDQPRRLYVDFAQSHIPAHLRNPIPIGDGLLRQARAGQFSSDTVRVVLDIDSLSDYKVFSLNDPFRVVIDVHGHRQAPVRIAQGDNGGRVPVTVTKTSVARPRKTGGQPMVLSAQKKRAVGPTVSPAQKPSGQGELTLAQQLGLGVRKIVIDPGHGGKDPGAMAFGLKEKDIVLKVAKKVANILKTTHRYQVALTRSKDAYLALEERTAKANTQDGDLFISIHVNAHPDKTIGGIETYFLNLATNADAMRVAAMENATSTHSISELEEILNDLMKNAKIDESSRLARFVQTNLVNGMGKKYRARDLGVKQAPFYVLIGAEMPAVLAEISFITNPKEAELLRDDRYLNRIAEQIAAGIVAYVEHNQTAALNF